MTPSDGSYTQSSDFVTKTRTKFCSKCHVPKNIEDFHKSGRDGLQGWCKVCVGIALRLRADKNLVKVTAIDKELYASMNENERPLHKQCIHSECSYLGQVQPPENFARRRFSLDGLSLRCRQCELNIRRKVLSPESQLEYAKLWREQNKEELNRLTKAWRDANPEECKRLGRERRFRQYGVTPQWYDEQLAFQGGGCAICGSKDPKSNGGTFHVDHDHSCCNVGSKGCHACDNCRRGLLCSVCNTWLGIIERIEWKRKAIAYLNKYSKKPAVDPDQGSLFDF